MKGSKREECPIGSEFENSRTGNLKSGKHPETVKDKQIFEVSESQCVYNEMTPSFIFQMMSNRCLAFFCSTVIDKCCSSSSSSLLFLDIEYIAYIYDI